MTIFYAFSASAQDISHPKYEVRAVWLTTIGGLDWPHSYAQSVASTNKQQKELTDILDRLQRANINTVLLQTRVRGTTIYPSTIEPWDGCMSGFPGKSPGYDPLAFAIEECHKRGMELHAWVVTIPVGKWNKTGCKRINSRHRGIVKRIGDEGYMRPENPLTAKYIANICEEITRNYDIDGIHLDYIRYPEQEKLKAYSLPTCRNNITRIVKAVHSKVKALKPWVKISCSPLGKHSDLSRYRSNGWNAYNTVAQDAQAWLKDGLMDQLYPMIYYKGNNFFPFAADWQEECHDRSISAGLGIYFMSPCEGNWTIDMVRRQLYFLRSEGIGHCFFRCKFLLDNVQGIYDFVANELNRYPALIPPMTWAKCTPPSPPSSLAYDHKKRLLSWQPADSDTYLYNIYMSDNSSNGVHSPENMIAVRTAEKQIQIPPQHNLFDIQYAVTAIDRYGNESEPSVFTIKGIWKR
ncbi:MAG: family 10 glycosylhydrolase [Prevotella sp.]|nr:family 10 glycosylhydrolase [Prevotella sp.]